MNNVRDPKHLASLSQHGMLCLKHDMQQVTVASGKELTLAHSTLVLMMRCNM
jgi:hypothetical protein